MFRFSKPLCVCVCVCDYEMIHLLLNGFLWDDFLFLEKFWTKLFYQLGLTNSAGSLQKVLINHFGNLNESRMDQILCVSAVRFLSQIASFISLKMILSI